MTPWLLVTCLFVLPQDTLSLVDPARNRSIPVAIYTESSHQVPKPKLVIISHGYGGTNTSYSFIGKYLAAHGYYVVSIQHEIPGDEPLPTTGNPYETRKPSWERGVENARVLDPLERSAG